MKACVWIGACACALLLAGNTLAADVNINLHIGQLLNTRIETFPHAEEEITCYLDPPSGATIPFIRGQDSELYQLTDPDKFWLLPFSPLSGCAVNVLITDAKDQGIWRLHFKTTSGSSGERSYEVVLGTKGEPPHETETENNIRNIEHLDEQIFNTAIGSEHEVRINYNDFVTTESCHIVTPNEEEYNLDHVDLLSDLGIQVLKDVNTACGVHITVQSEKSVGKWTLYSRDIRYSENIERRVNIIINVKENVRAMPEEVTITEGSDLYVRLEHPTPHFETCKLVGPNGRTDIPYKIDENHRSSCGFIVPHVQLHYAGRWEIVFGDAITYTAAIFVTTNVPWEGAVIKMEWLKDRPVHMEVGPDDAVYCRIAAPEDVVVFETFGRCSINLNRPTEKHSGTWTMVVGTPGRVLTTTHTITIIVRNADPRPQVITRVESQQPAVLLTCAIPGTDSIRSCKFMDPSGRVLMAPQGVGEDRYRYHGVGVSLESNVTKSECGLRITNPVAEELGMWRCSVGTFEDQVYHGFLRVLLPWVTAEVGTVLPPTEPTLTATHNMVAAVEGDSVTMSCSIQSEIQYCYFRARNGTVFSIAPSFQSDVMEYVGAGFDAGECGIRFRNLQERDSGPWSCHVGFTNPNAEEQRATFRVSIQKAMAATQHLYSWGIVVEGQVHDSRELEYCRFVRIDGLGFGSFSTRLPERVTIDEVLSRGHCSIHIEGPTTTLERHPWTVVARIVGQEVEVSDTTDHNLEPPPPPPGPPQIIVVRRSYTWLIFLMLAISFLLVGLSLSSKNSRRWVNQRATQLRNSFRKQPVPPPATTNNTAMAA